MKKALIIILIVILILTTYKKNQTKEIVIPTDSIRLRIVSNSNSEMDIANKKKLKTEVEDYLYDLVKDSSTKSDINKLIISNMENIERVVGSTLGNNSFTIDYGQNYFPAKIYKGVIYKDGLYDSLVITIGNGKGSNWWCVLFPPLCLIEDNNNTTDVEYQLFVSRIINNNR